MRPRILGIYPNWKGIGFAIIERGDKLVDWGIRYLPQRRSVEEKHQPDDQEYLRLLADLIEVYAPDVLALEDWTATTCRRGPRMVRILRKASLLGRRRLVSVSRIPYGRELMPHAPLGVRTRYDLSVLLSRLYPELAAILPKKRKPWSSESVWTSMFVALAYAVVCIQRRGG